MQPCLQTIAEQEIYDGERWTSGSIVVSAYYGKALITEAINSIEEVDDRTGGVTDRWQPQINSAKSGFVKRQDPTRQPRVLPLCNIFFVSARRFPFLSMHTTSFLTLL